MTANDRKRLVNALRTRTTWDKGCLVYTTQRRRPYMSVGFDRKLFPVSRIILAAKHNLDIEDRSWVACHGPCDNARCVCPSHLYVGTYSSNIRDAMNRSQFNLGTKNGMSKLTPDQVRTIRLYQGPGTEIAQQLGVSQSAVSNIRRGKRWRHVT